MGLGWVAGLALVALAGRNSSQEGDDDAAGERGRAELAALVKRSFELQKAPKEARPQDKDLAFGVPFVVVEGPGMRVLATSGEEEARRVAVAMGAARSVFVELTGATTAFYPSGLSAFLLGTSAAKEAFLLKHPQLGTEARARLTKLEGSGVPNTADWAFWEGDEEKRLDGMVRFCLDWLVRTQGVTTELQPWLHEGLGLYLCHALVGTHLTWFVQPRMSGGARGPENVALRSQMDELGADWMGLARGLFAAQQEFDLEELLHLEVRELEPIDYLRAHALAAYLVEVHRPGLGAVLARVGKGDDPRTVLEESLGFPLDELRRRLDVWLERRDVLVARAEGRRSEAELRAMWQGLSASRKTAAIAHFQRRVDELDTQQLRWLRAVLAGAPAEAPSAEPAPVYDPKVHAPAQPIARKRLTPSDGRVKRLLKEVRKEPEPRALVLAHDFDWGRALVVRCGAPLDPEAVFQNALRGAPPGADLARALVLAALDHPDDRKLQAAFAHAYTDRDGNAYPLTLYELWATGTTMEMPDVDALGIVHDVLDDWHRWVAPVPSTQHEALYKLIGELFTACRRSHELRLSLAELFLLPGATPRPGYETQALNLQALWAEQGSEPAKLAPLLPDSERWEAFLADLVVRCQRDFKLYAQGRRRAAQLRLDGESLRRALGAALDEAAAAPEEGALSPGGGEPAGGD